MSRYRQTGLNGNYALQLSAVIADGMSIAFAIPLRIYEKLHGKSESVITREVIESIRLIADETAGGVVLCSTGLKAKVKGVSLTNTTIPVVTILLDYPTDAVKTAAGTESGVKWITYTITKYGITTTYTLRESDQLTIEMDWGEGPDDTYKAIDQAKSEIKQHVRNTAGDCIFPDFEWPCLPFDKPNGYSALDNDLDIYTGDFDPQMGSEAAKLFVGAIIKVTGDCVIEDETYGFPAGTSLSVANAVSSDQAGYEQGLYWNFQENSELAGVTQTIQLQKDHYYRVTGFHNVYDMTNHETVEGYVITYEEVDPQSISDLVKRAAEKLLSEYRESAGSMIIATSAEYAAFKSHMQTQIANILTPITEAE